MSHTPGNWKAIEDQDGSNNPNICINADDYGIIADIGGGCPKTRRANARLIAAAPRMLAALRCLVIYAEKTRNCNVCAGGHLDHEPDCPVDDARAAIAIAKAKGEAT